jgi:hypothetical protein
LCQGRSGFFSPLEIARYSSNSAPQSLHKVRPRVFDREGPEASSLSACRPHMAHRKWHEEHWTMVRMDSARLRYLSSRSFCRLPSIRSFISTIFFIVSFLKSAEDMCTAPTTLMHGSVWEDMGTRGFRARGQDTGKTVPCLQKLIVATAEGQVKLSALSRHLRPSRRIAQDREPR